VVGKRIAHYEILAKLGEGGMGVVYRARDTKLGRDVALKVLPEQFARDPQRMGRFSREAHVLASLNHPNIASIHGLEEQNGVHALVMELVEGPTLADRIGEGAIPLDEALPLAHQMAEALEYAHEHGVIHRDLKPANVKVTEEGTVKILDFGLAKAMAEEEAVSDPDHSPTLTLGATKAGVILGTAAYMAPEQARGKRVDKRADIWAFGVVLYEMLTGKRLFRGEDLTETLAAVVMKDPDLGDAPKKVRRLLEKCLEKNPKKRLHDISGVALLLEAPAEPVHEVKSSRLPWAVGAAIVASLATGLVFWALTRPQPPAVGRFVIPLAPDQAFSSSGRHIVAISPDGTRIVHTANGGLWLRPLDQLQATPIAGTEDGATSPFFSADGQWIGFWSVSDQQLKKVSVTGGAPVTLCDSTNPWGASWGDDGMILYGQGTDGIWRVPAAGATPEQVLAVEEGEVAHGPQMLPGGEWVLFTLRPNGVTEWNQAQIVVQSLETGERALLVQGGQDARYISTGHLVYSLNNVLTAVPFDLGARSVTGGAVPLVEGVTDTTVTGAAQFAVADNGALVYVPGSSGTQMGTLVWMSRDGRDIEPIVDELIEYPRYVRLSPDDRRVALTTGPYGEGDLWVYDLAGRPPTPLTFATGNYEPVWSPDGTRVAFDSARGGVRNLFWMPADGSTLEPERLLTSPNPQYPRSWSPDDDLIFQEQRPETGWDIFALPLEGEREPRLVVGTEFNERFPQLSPSGRWLAYVSDVTGRNEIWVRKYPGPAAPIPVSRNGGI